MNAFLGGPFLSHCRNDSDARRALTRRQPLKYHEPVTAIIASFIFALAKLPIVSRSKCGILGNSFGTTTASTIAGPSTAKAALMAALSSPGWLA